MTESRSSLWLPFALNEFPTGLDAFIDDYNIGSRGTNIFNILPFSVNAEGVKAGGFFKVSRVKVMGDNGDVTLRENVAV